jgi:hypothetical protein
MIDLLTRDIISKFGNKCFLHFTPRHFSMNHIYLVSFSGSCLMEMLTNSTQGLFILSFPLGPIIFLIHPGDAPVTYIK